jgi:hypothetical protein
MPEHSSGPIDEHRVDCAVVGDAESLEKRRFVEIDRYGSLSHIPVWDPSPHPTIDKPLRETASALDHRKFVNGEPWIAIFEFSAQRHPSIDQRLVTPPERQDNEVQISFEVGGKEQPMSFQI